MKERGEEPQLTRLDGRQQWMTIALTEANVFAETRIGEAWSCMTFCGLTWSATAWPGISARLVLKPVHPPTQASSGIHDRRVCCFRSFGIRPHRSNCPVADRVHAS